MRLLIMSDTHLPTRARALPEQVWQEVDRCDVVVHAGDWIDVGLLDALEARADRVLGCWGNNDGPQLRARLPEVARATLAGVRVAVTHETGAATGRESRMRAAHPETDLLIFGHSHIPWDSIAPSVSIAPSASNAPWDTNAPAAGRHPGTSPLRLLNPGSPTDRRRQPLCTYLTASLDAGVISEVVLHELGAASGRS